GRKPRSSTGAHTDQPVLLLGEIIRWWRTTSYGNVELVSPIDLTSNIGSVVKRLRVIGGLAVRAKRLGHRATQRIRDARKSPYERWMAHRLRIRRGLYPVHHEPHEVALLSFVTSVWNTSPEYLRVLVES